MIQSWSRKMKNILFRIVNLKKKKLNEIDFLRLLKDDSVRSIFFKPAVSCFAINETSDKLKILLLFCFCFF